MGRGTRGAVPLVGVVILGLAAVGGRARADVVADFLPAASVGWTNNAAAAPPQNNPQSDEFGTISGTARGYVRNAHAEHTLGLRLADTVYLHQRGPANFLAEAGWVSDMYVSRALELRLAATGAYGRTSGTSGVELDAGALFAQFGNSNQYVTTGAVQEAIDQLSLRTRLVQNLRYTGVHYVRPAGALGISDSYVFGALLRVEREVGENQFSLEGDITENYVPGRGEGLSDQVVIIQPLAGWRRDLAEAWWVQLKAGALGVFDFHGTDVVKPAGIAALTYRRVTWFATLMATQMATTNLFLGAATLSDQALLRLALPLTRNERYYIMGYASYTYARLVDEVGTHRAYDLTAVGASFTARSEKYPIWGSLDYIYSSQVGNENTTFPVEPGGPALPGTIPDIHRQTILLTIGGAFVHGAANPPMFHGVLPAIIPLSEKQSGADAGNFDDAPGGGSSGNVQDVPR